MGEKKLAQTISVKEAAELKGLSPDFISQNVRNGAIKVEHFNGRPIKPYRIFVREFEALFTIATTKNKSRREIERLIGKKPIEKEELWPA